MAKIPKTIESIESKRNEIVRIWNSFNSNNNFVTEASIWEKNRDSNINDIKGYIETYLISNGTGINELRKFAIEINSRSAINQEWDLWGYKGKNGKTLNSLINNDKTKLLPKTKLNTLSDVFKESINAPTNIDDAKIKINNFVDFVGSPYKGDVNSLLSFFWHIQEPNAWPIYYVTLRKSFIKLNIWNKTGDEPTNYETFYNLIYAMKNIISEISSSSININEIEHSFKNIDSFNTYVKYIGPTNQILYGPPGTGKTYNTIYKAAEIINGSVKDYDHALKLFNENLHSKIEFITFHQNYSYEDFIQGLRPNVKSKSESLTFEKSDGVFKRIVTNALYEYLIFLDPNTFSTTDSYEKKVSILIANNIKKIKELFINDESSEQIIEVPQEEKEISKRDDNQSSEKINHTIKNDNVTKKDINSIPNYVIIIDEINRANISRVFGELITLIEPDKRFPEKLMLTATLPSGDTFVVPKNLYIIGTMNTADKSIALLDIALRRRFEFEAMYPDDSKVNSSFKDFFNLLNKLIIKEKGHDYQIGHSYFMKKDKENFYFLNTINKKVIPLLLEYYMTDKTEVEKLINEALKDMKFEIVKDKWPLEIKDK